MNGVFGWNVAADSVFLAVGGAIIAIYGHDWLHRAFRVLFLDQSAFLRHLQHRHCRRLDSPHAPVQVVFSWTAFAAQFTASFAYNITYAPCVSDYTRYLPKSASAAGLVLSVYLGGLAIRPLAHRLGGLDGLLLSAYPTASSASAWVAKKSSGISGTLMVLVSAVALAATMGLNAYSAMLTLLTGNRLLRQAAARPEPFACGVSGW